MEMYDDINRYETLQTAGADWSVLFCRKWTRVETIMTVTDSVRDVAFAPNLGRSYHMLAIASKDVTVMTLKPLTRWAPHLVHVLLK